MPDPESSLLLLQPTLEAKQLPACSRIKLSNPIKLSVVIVNYRQWKYTEQLVRKLGQCELVRNGQAEIIVIDNNSSYHPAIRRLRSKPHVSLRRWTKNRGFSCAVNEGCKLSSGDWVLILNPDITPENNFLDNIDTYLNANNLHQSKVGVIGFGLRNPDGSVQGSTGPFPTFMGTLARKFLPRAWRKYSLHKNDEAQKVDWITGCCMLAQRVCLEKLKKFDTDYFLYYEDVDLCKRIAKAGYDVCYEPSLAVVHHAPIHVRRVPPRLRVITRQALMTYARKHWSKNESKWMCRVIRCEAFVMGIWARFLGDSRAVKWYDRLARYSKLMSSGSLNKARVEFLAALAEPSA